MIFIYILTVLFILSLVLLHTSDGAQYTNQKQFEQQESNSITMPWDLPLISPNLDSLITNDTLQSLFNAASPIVSDKLIPRNLWIAFRLVPPENRMYPHIRTLLFYAKQNKWSVNLIGDHKMDLFMKTFYSGICMRMCLFVVMFKKLNNFIIIILN